MQTLLASMNNAFDARQRSGVTRNGSAVDCPIGHTQIMLRLNWMDGFSKGRTSIVRQGLA
jgi:hypothetical protein